MKINHKIGVPRVRFTPGFFKTAYANYKNHYYLDLITMMKESEIDTQVAGCLLGRRAGFQREISVIPYADEKRDTDLARKMEMVFKRLNLRELFKAIFEAKQYIYSVIDFEWDVLDGWQAPVSFKKYDQKYFKHDEKDDYRLKIDFGNRLKKIPDTALVLEYDAIPVMLPVLREYILKNFGLESWAGFIETFGQGILLGKYPPGAEDDIISALKTAVDSIARSSRGVMPDNTDIDIVETNRTTGDHEKFIAAADKGISISLLGHANAVEQSKGLQVGENNSSYKAVRAVSVDDLYFIDEALQKLLTIIWRRNVQDGRVPAVKTDKGEPLDKKLHMQIVDMFYEHGGEVQVDEYKKLGLTVSPEQKPLVKPADPFNQ